MVHKFFCYQNVHQRCNSCYRQVGILYFTRPIFLYCVSNVGRNVYNHRLDLSHYKYEVAIVKKQAQIINNGRRDGWKLQDYRVKNIFVPIIYHIKRNNSACASISAIIFGSGLYYARKPFNDADFPPENPKSAINFARLLLLNR